MFRKSLAIVLSATLLATALFIQSVSAQSVANSNEVMTKVAKLGTGRSARVEVKLKDGSKVKGYVGAADSDSFTVVDSKTGATQTFAYSDVLSVKKPSRGLSPLTWGIIGGAAAAVIVGFTVVKPVLCDGGAGC